MMECKTYSTIQFEKDILAMGIQLSNEQMEQFLIYYEMLLEWNQVMNLTAITEYEDVMKKHFTDSLSLVKAISMDSGKTLMDVGTGAGFPGLALKIAFPGLQVTLMDSLKKRVDYLDAVINRLHVSGVELVHGRAEDVARLKGKREQYDICVSRAVANLSTLSEYCIPFVKVGGVFVSYKSERLSEELEQAKHAICLLGAGIERRVEFSLPDSQIYRNLVVIRKKKPTSQKYPRKAGQPQKNPIF